MSLITYLLYRCDSSIDLMPDYKGKKVEKKTEKKVL